MQEEQGKVYMVIRKEDGAEVPLTCTPAQLQHHLARGYELPGAATPARKAKGEAAEALEGQGANDHAAEG